MRAAVLVVALLATAAHASVPFHDWQGSSFRASIDDAAKAKKPIVLIVTQPDWCPPCIKLDKRWLKNPADTEARDVLKDSMVLEVRGYEELGAKILRKEGVQFQGTPTTFVFAPPAPKQSLGQARLLGSIVGAPDDYTNQLKTILASEGDALAPLRAAVDQACDDVARATALLDLAAAAMGRGEPAGAESALGRVAELAGTPENAGELGALKRKAGWQRASVVTLRVRKDYEKALEEIDAYAAASPVTDEERESFGYSRAWALLHLGQRDAAVSELDASLPKTVDGADTFLYFCFRSDDQALWTLGAERAKAVLAEHPDEAVLWQGLGRIQRRLGQLDDAERSFARAVALSEEGDDRLSYEGQLENVREEKAAAGAGKATGAPRKASR